MMFEGDGHIYQNCFVVPDIDYAMAQWMKGIGAGPFFILRHVDNLPIEYRGAPSTMDISVALGQAGPIHIELIQVHCDNPTVYTDMYPKGTGGFHHVGMIAKDIEAAIHAYEKSGSPLVLRGVVASTPFAYVDSRRSLGFFTEFHQDTPQIRGLYQGVADAALEWKGENPIRSMADLLP
jgi:glyoxalase/bleomycin resistance protein/dioxygenase superfamily protein